MHLPLTQRVSIIVPVLNEQDTVEQCYARLVGVFAGLPGYEYEIVFTDNHSTDDTFPILSRIAAADPAVKVIRFSRNFGYQQSVLFGYQTATGDCAIQVDADLQDPPELIPSMLALWRQGHKVIYGVRRRLPDGFATALARRAFYRGLAALSEDDLPVDAGEFRLVDARILQELRAVDDTSPYLRGLISAMGFSQVAIAYDRAARTAGKSKFSIRPMIALAVDGLLNHSLLPLRIASAVGLCVGSVTFALIFVYLAARLLLGSAWPAGFATTTLLLLMSITLNALFLGILGEYLGRIFLQSKRRPRPIVEAEVNRTEAVRERDAPAVH